VFFGLVAVSGFRFQHDFSFWGTNISRLGRPSMNPDGHAFMVAGCILTNLFMLPYYASLKVWYTGEPQIDRPLRFLIVLSYLSVVALVGLAVWNADHRIPHRVAGGLYFMADAVMMLSGAWVAWKHPGVSNWLAPMAVMAAVFSLAFLASAGKASWTEWISVSLNFSIAILMGFQAKKWVLEGREGG